MATHSSVLAWRIPGTAEPGGLPSMGSHRVGHNWSDLAAVAATWGSIYLHTPGGLSENRKLFFLTKPFASKEMIKVQVYKSPAK